MKTYEARTFGNVFVWADGKRTVLPPRLDLRNHSPTGLSWGYEGSGCAQLALALLCDVYNDEVSLRFYQDFKRRVIARQSSHLPFQMTAAQIVAAVEKIEANS